MERYQKIGIVNIRHNLLPHMIVSIFLIILAPAVMGMENLDQQQTAKIMEVYLSLTGIILLIPVFIPDMNPDIKEVISSKKEPLPILHLIRTAESVIIILLIGTVFLYLLSRENSSFSWGKMLYTYMANAMFLGGLGMFLFALADQIVFAYMIPLVYYVMNYGAGSRQLGMFWLFSMQAGSLTEKHYLIISGIFLIAGAIGIAKWKMVRRNS